MSMFGEQGSDQLYECVCVGGCVCVCVYGVLCVPEAKIPEMQN